MMFYDALHLHKMTPTPKMFCKRNQLGYAIYLNEIGICFFLRFLIRLNLRNDVVPVFIAKQTWNITTLQKTVQILHDWLLTTENTNQ